MNKKQETTFLARIKDRVDFIYGIIIECPDGYHGGFSQDGLTADVARALLNRGVIKREKDITRPRLVFIYRWNANLAPTKTLYTNIMVDVRDKRREYGKNTKPRKEREATAPVVDEVAAPDVETVANPKEICDVVENPLGAFSTQELWDEIKRRGGSIEGGRLVIIRKEYVE